MKQISDFLGDYKDTQTRLDTFDSQVQSDAPKISNDYASIIALSIRQALDATEITISKNINSSWNTDDILVFANGDSEMLNYHDVNVGLTLICRTFRQRKYH
jgi:hypothetical protein